MTEDERFATLMAMTESFLHYGLPALFIIGFLAATLLPIASEWFLVSLILTGSDPVQTVAVATAGNVLGAMVTWAIGLWGSPWFIRRVLRIGDRERQRVQRFYQRWGIWSLLLAWAPIIGDPLCLIGGLLRVHLIPFTLLVTLGKLGRYSLLTWLTLSAAN